MPSILIADDELHIRLLLEQTLEDLEEEGVKLLFAANGEAALDIIVKEKPELVLLDVMMPVMSGFEVCNIIKNKLQMNSVYIIMITAKGQEFDKRKGEEAGADIYMTKPFNPDEILNKAREILGI